MLEVTHKILVNIPTDGTKTTLGDILGDVFDKLLEDSHE